MSLSQKIFVDLHPRKCILSLVCRRRFPEHSERRPVKRHSSGGNDNVGHHPCYRNRRHGLDDKSSNYSAGKKQCSRLLKLTIYIFSIEALLKLWIFSKLSIIKNSFVWNADWLSINFVTLYLLFFLNEDVNKFVNETDQMFSWRLPQFTTNYVTFSTVQITLVAAQVDFVVGTMLSPTDEQKSKGFVGYSLKNYQDNLWSAYTVNEQVLSNLYGRDSS
jgi:hypothetical protein